MIERTCENGFHTVGYTVDQYEGCQPIESDDIDRLNQEYDDIFNFCPYCGKELGPG